MSAIFGTFSRRFFAVVIWKGILSRAPLLGLLWAAGAGEVMATLGQAPLAFPASTVARVAPAKKLVSPSNPSSALYTLHEVQLENGTRVQEFATPAGIVFAVAWRGPVLPDLSALLGNYFQTFKAETEQVRLSGKRGSPANIQRDDVVIRSNGRMRNFFGYAYAPDLIPAGVRMTDVLQ